MGYWSDLWGRLKTSEESRAITSVPWDVGAPKTTAVNQNRALSLTPVFAANRHIVDQISTLPLKGYRKTGDTRVPMQSLPPLFRTLQDEGRLIPWLSAAVSSMVLRGNAVGLITGRDGFGYATDVVWLQLDQIQVDDSGPRPRWFWKGLPLDSSEVIHIPWVTVPGRTLGLSPIEYYAATVNQGLDAQSYASGWFEAGGVPPGTFKNSEKKVNQDEADAIKSRLVAAIRTRKPIVYGSDWDYQAITISPEQAQFVETSKLSANQVAAIYGLDPTEVGGEAANSLTYSNEEHRQITRLQNLRPYLVRLEHGFTAQLPPPQFVRFNTDATIRVDATTRWETHKVARQIGARSIDEIRALEDLPPLPDGQGASYEALGRTRDLEARWMVPNTPNDLLRGADQ